MSQIRTAKAIDVGAFPGSTFVVDGSPPIAQCQESEIQGAGAAVVINEPYITTAGFFVGIDVTGKKVTTFLGPPDDGPFNVLSNDDDVLLTDHVFTVTNGFAGVSVTDAGQAYLTRNESSFQRFIESQGKAHTTKGGQLYTDLADPPMDDACSDTWSPE